MRTRLVVIALALAAVGVAAALTLRGGTKHSPSAGATPVKVARGGVGVVLAYSPEKEGLLKPLLADLNASGLEVDGHRIAVSGVNASSGDAERRIAAGTFRPTIWSPASSLWGRLLDYEARRRVVADDNPSLVRTPLVIAMWQPEARALGWPRKPLGFADILRLATSKRGWAAYGLPTFGSFKLGHTNPDFSTAGLSFVAAQYLTATGKREGLTVADVSRPAVRSQVRRIEQSIVHYGDTTLFFADQLKAHGPGYASAVAVEETTLLDYNRTRPRGSMKLVAIYPAEGTFFSDDPLMTLDAKWVSPLQRRAAAKVTAWLLKRVTPALAARYGFRPGDRTLRPVAPITRANGVDPAQPTHALALPEPAVLARIRRSWHEDRKAANVMLVVDTSGSMNDEGKLSQVKRGLDVFLRSFSPRDRVGLVTFSDGPHLIVPLATVGQNRARLRSAFRNLVADGGTAVYDATADGFEEVRKLHDASRINAVVVLTDGEDNSSRTTATDLERELRRDTGEGQGIRVFTIAYGSGADRDTLADIGDAGGGRSYVGDPKEIEAVYLQISSFF